jgi:hypothetical protein
MPTDFFRYGRALKFIKLVQRYCFKINILTNSSAFALTDSFERLIPELEIFW